MIGSVLILNVTMVLVNLTVLLINGSQLLKEMKNK
jgi:hypothetical protein